MIEHFNGTSLKNILLIVIEDEFIKFSFFPVIGPKPGVQLQNVEGINVNTSVDFDSFLVKFFGIFINLIKRI